MKLNPSEAKTENDPHTTAELTSDARQFLDPI